nr:DUF4158 domain-containing protein [Micromonospora matsumotoense]
MRWRWLRTPWWAGCRSGWDRVGELRGYGEREQTRTGHLREVAGFAGWRSMDTAEWEDLDEFLFARAMEHDSPKLLFRLACEYLLSSGAPARGDSVCCGGWPRIGLMRGRRRGRGCGICSPSGGVPSWICCWPRTPISARPRWRGWVWGRRRRARAR